jgi:UDP-N-acetylmuramoyl-tripeptide--D-alanyl-D-alanine ligase
VPALDLNEVVRATGGRLVRGSAARKVEGFSIDTRELGPGALFFAMKGSRTDGHAYLAEARRVGAAAAIVSQEVADDRKAPETLIRVEDVEEALTRCGELAREKCRARFVAVTGSTGKTTTKELVAAGLGANRRVHRTARSFNNHLGVPLSLLACPEDAEYAVMELGMSAPGEIAALAALARPQIGLVTNVCPAHLEFFDSIDDIAAAKGELFGSLGDDDVSVVNLDDPQVRVQAARHAGRRVTFGRQSSCDLVLESVSDRFVPGAGLGFRCDGRSHRVALTLGGAHNARNALAALATVVAAGEDLEAAARAMEKVEPGPGRGRRHHLPQDVIVIDDSYNSSPEALAAVLETIRHTDPPGRKILVMGDMLELGPREAGFHRDAGRKAARAGVQILIGVGPKAKLALETARVAGVPETRQAKDAAAAAEDLPALVRPGDLVIVKGSRRVALERVVAALLETQVEAS